MTSSPFTIEEHVIDTSYMREYPRGAWPQNAPLKLAIKKYIPVDNLNPQPGDVTLIGAHGAGFPKVGLLPFPLHLNISKLFSCFLKELYEPLWEELLARSKVNEFRIRAIWMADVANQGASGVLNEKYLGNDREYVSLIYLGISLIRNEQHHGWTTVATSYTWSTTFATTCPSPSWVSDIVWAPYTCKTPTEEKPNIEPPSS